MNQHHTRNRPNPANSEAPDGVAGREEAADTIRDPLRQLRQLKEQFGPRTGGASSSVTSTVSRSRKCITLQPTTGPIATG
jgi:hypothetical protein